MNVLVTGGRGFIGINLVESLAKKGYQVDILSRSDVVCVDPGKCSSRFINVNLLDSAFDFEILVRKYDVIFNCAGELHNESLMHPLHVKATGLLVQACKKITHSQKRSIHWVQLSSIGAYGPNQSKANADRFVTEETTPAPIGEYEVTKTLADSMIINAADDFFTFSILRPSNVYGADMPNNSIRQLTSIIKKRLFFYIGKPGAISNYVHIHDVVEALILCGFDSRARGQIFNLSNDCDQAIVINALAEHVGTPAPHLRLNETFARLISFAFSWLPKFPLKKSRIDALVSRTHYDTQKIERTLEFKPSRDVKNTIAEVLE